MSRVMNEGVMMRFKAVTANLLTVVGLIVEPSTAIEKPKGSLGVSLSIRQPPITVTSSNLVISTSLSSFFFFSGMLRSNGISHQSIGKR